VFRASYDTAVESGMHSGNLPQLIGSMMEAGIHKEA
jgi:hypothetical protein